jgi:transcriptional regulator with XRE-family HTH domain
MNVSTRKPTTALSELRKLIGITQKELSALTGCPVATIQGVELKRRSLSLKVALKISSVTGVSCDWLMTKGTQAKPIDNSGRLYTKETFKNTKRIFNARKNPSVRIGLLIKIVIPSLLKMFSVMLSAVEEQDQTTRIMKTLWDNLSELEAEFGQKRLTMGMIKNQHNPVCTLHEIVEVFCEKWVEPFKDDREMVRKYLLALKKGEEELSPQEAVMKSRMLSKSGSRSR